jgi:putative hydrolase
MIDLHTHTFLSDGVLIPAELVQRATVAGYSVLGISDHVDAGTIGYTLETLQRSCASLQQASAPYLVAGVEITHVPPALIADVACMARGLGARLVVVHGESPVEPVPEGTNRAAVEADIDLLAHPGLIERETVVRATERRIYLEISARAGHSLGNGHVVALAREVGALEFLVVSSDTHAPEDLLTQAFRRIICRGAGLTRQETDRVEKNAQDLWRKVST